MPSHADKSHDNQTKAAESQTLRRKTGSRGTFQFVDNRAEVKQLERLQEMADNSPQAEKVAQLQAMLDNSPYMKALNEFAQMIFRRRSCYARFIAAWGERKTLEPLPRVEWSAPSAIWNSILMTPGRLTWVAPDLSNMATKTRRCDGLHGRWKCPWSPICITGLHRQRLMVFDG